MRTLWLCSRKCTRKSSSHRTRVSLSCTGNISREMYIGPSASSIPRASVRRWTSCKRLSTCNWSASARGGRGHYSTALFHYQELLVFTVGHHVDIERHGLLLKDRPVSAMSQKV